MYSLFAAMEMEIRSLLQFHGITGVKDKLTDRICKNDDVLFYWATIASDWEENEANALLQIMLVEHWVTIRGYSFKVHSLKNISRNTRKLYKSPKDSEKTCYTLKMYYMMLFFIILNKN